MIKLNVFSTQGNEFLSLPWNWSRIDLWWDGEGWVWPSADNQWITPNTFIILARQSTFFCTTVIRTSVWVHVGVKMCVSVCFVFGKLKSIVWNKMNENQTTVFPIFNAHRLWLCSTYLSLPLDLLLLFFIFINYPCFLSTCPPHKKNQQIKSHINPAMTFPT